MANPTYTLAHNLPHELTQTRGHSTRCGNPAIYSIPWAPSPPDPDSYRSYNGTWRPWNKPSKPVYSDGWNAAFDDEREYFAIKAAAELDLARLRSDEQEYRWQDAVQDPTLEAWNLLVAKEMELEELVARPYTGSRRHHFPDKLPFALHTMASTIMPLLILWAKDRKNGI